MTPSDQKLISQIQKWQTSYQIVAPSLLYFEVANALYQYQKHGILSFDLVQSALRSAGALPIKLHHDALLHQQALQVAKVHNVAATYDAHYLALAQRLDAELWTVDKKLFNTVSAKLEWVKLWT